jgi:hypothetical protein
MAEKRRGKGYQRRVVHAQDQDSLVLWAVLAPAADVGLEDVSSVQKGHLAVGLDPDLVAGVGGNDGQGRDVQAELARLGELAQTDAQREQVVAGYRGGEVGEGFAHVVDAGALGEVSRARRAGSREQSVPARGRHCGRCRRPGQR